MVLTAASSRVARQLRRRRFAALVAIGVLLVHDAVFVAQDGLGTRRDAALAAAPHGYWLAFTALALLLGALDVGAAVHGFLRLGRALRGLPAVPTTAGTPGYAGGLLRLWRALFAEKIREVAG